MTRTPLIDKLWDRRRADSIRFADRVRQCPRVTWSLTEPLMVVAADHPAWGRRQGTGGTSHLVAYCPVRGEVSTDPGGTRRRWATALAAQNVHGLVLGRSVLYPPDSGVVAAIENAVHLLGAQV